MLKITKKTKTGRLSPNKCKLVTLSNQNEKKKYPSLLYKSIKVSSRFSFNIKVFFLFFFLRGKKRVNTTTKHHDKKKEQQKCIKGK